MKPFIGLASSLAIVQTLVAGSAIPSYFQSASRTPCDLSSAKVQHDLGSRLSKTTTIIGPSNPDFNESTARWDIYAVPKVQVVIEPGHHSKPACQSKIELTVYLG
jgi:hypothetical protein